MTRAPVRPAILRWARERAGVGDVKALLGRFPKLADWEAGVVQPTLKQLEAFAKAMHLPVGYLFLPVPPEEPLPIPDFRTMEGRGIRRSSPDLLDMLYAAQERQSWYRDFSQTVRLPEIDFVDSARLDERPEDVARRMAETLSFDLAARAACRTWEEALRLFIAQADAAGVLVMVSGVVLSNTHRALDPQEFRGFALADERAPLVFINGADTKAAQMFTLAHELAHVWLGQSAVSDAEARVIPEHAVERRCNAVAAELLVPLEALREAYDPGAALQEETGRLARRFKVSTLVVLRRIHDAGGLTREAYWRAYEEELERLRSLPKGSGGDFYLTLGARAGKTFARALVVSTLEGRTPFTEAFRLLGFKKMATFHELGHNLGVLP